jgi:hypothetical protein
MQNFSPGKQARHINKVQMSRKFYFQAFVAQLGARK